jgi:tetratricopeptide (TPR) repeat protein
MSSSKFSKFSSTSALTLPLILLLALTWLLSLRPVRLKIGDYYFNQGNYDQAANWYEKVLRKKNSINSFNENLKFKSFTINEEEILIKLKSTYYNLASFYYNRSRKYTNLNLAELELKRLLEFYDCATRNLSNYGSPVNDYDNELLIFAKKAYIDLAEISGAEKPRKVFDSYAKFSDLRALSEDTLYAKKWLHIFSSLRGINLLENPNLSDLDNDGLPDGYTFASGGPKGTYPNKRVIKNGEYNVYQVYQKEGWSATYFNIGRVPANTFFTFSIDIKRSNPNSKLHSRLYTTRISEDKWGSGQNYSEMGLVEELEDGYRREFHTIKTNGNSDILLSGWIVLREYGYDDASVYVRKPKVEIGNKPTMWESSLKS